MASYVELIRQDVYYRNARSVSLWPSRVSELAHSIQTELKIPIWLKSGSVTYTNERATNLLRQLRVSDDASNVDLWDVVDETADTGMKVDLYTVFNTALVDCARIRAVVETENLTDTPFPKESFLVVLVRNAISNAHPRLSLLEEVPVAFPRHSSGETIPILKHMPKTFYAPLVVSIPQEIPVYKATSDPGRESTDEEEDSSEESELFKDPRPTMSEFLDERPETLEVEEEPEEQVLPPQFDAHFLAFPPSASTTLLSICHIPVLCMAEEEQLPVLMSTLLYQRRVWHISDPLIGLEFSKYATTIRVFVGWLEADLFQDRVLPQVHIGEIGTPVKLDLSTPSGALVVARFLCALKSHMVAVHDSVRRSVGAVISDTQLPSSRSWRIDTDARMKGPPSDLETNDKRDMITRWVKTQEYSEGVMSRRKQAGTSTHGSATSVPSPQQSTSTQPSYAASPSSVSSVAQKPEIRESRSHTKTVPTFFSQLSCSAFAATSKKTDARIFRWLFDRRVVPQSIPVDLEFWKEYSGMTSLIWPEEWDVKEDLPPVDTALEPCVEELLKSVALLKTRRGAIKCVSARDFPVDLRILQQSFSAIFQASRRSREKTELQETVYEAVWRHDHDRLLYDFFIRLVQPGKGDVRTRESYTSIASLEDPLSRPTLETTLRFPKSDSLQRDGTQQLQDSLRKLVHLQPPDLRGWLESRGSSLDAMSDEDQHSGYILTQFGSWTREINADTESRMISKLGQFPATGKCDAFGRLLVELPHVSSKDVGRFPLVDRAARKPDEDTSENEAKASATRSSTAAGADATRYTILSSAIRPSKQSLDDEKTGSAESIDTLTSKVERLRLESGATYLELPILTAEYKKAFADSFKGTNQLRMYMTASVKFLQAVGITNFAVYGVQTDGPIVVLPAAVVRDDNSVRLFERLVERLDISTPLGAWHYVTILCRLAKNHAKDLEEKFEQVKENLITSLLRDGDQMGAWTLDHQMDKLKAENRAKSPPQKKTTKQLSTAS